MAVLYANSLLTFALHAMLEVCPKIGAPRYGDLLNKH